MKLKMFFLSLFTLTLVAACDDNKIDINPGPPMTWNDSVSYFIGNSIGQQFANDSLVINYSYFIKALEDAKNGDTTFISPDKLRLFGMNFQDSMMKKQEAARVLQEEQMAKAAVENVEIAKKFLEENKSKPGIKVLPSGLQYQVIKQGSGKIPTLDDKVTFHIRAYDMKGNKFDDSHERGDPLVLPIKGQVPGWVEAFTNMKVGSTWKVFVPPSLGWGEKGIPNRIEPNSVTVFEFELIKAEKDDTPPQQAPPMQGQPMQMNPQGH